MTKFELTTALRNLKPFAEELKINGWAIKYTGVDYGVRADWDESDPYTDYCPYTWGLNLKNIIKLITL